jgi:hypothetical protein
MQSAWTLERHSSKTFATIMLIILLSITDAYLTLDLVSRGAAELNPVMAYYLDHSPFTFFGVKYLLTCASIFLILGVKNLCISKTRIGAKALFIFCIVAFAAVIKWELFLMIYAP